MTPDFTSEVPLQGAPILRWMLRRNTSLITCYLHARGVQSHEVVVVPHWEPSAAVLETYGAPMPALLRHAEIARRLRDEGWRVVDHICADRIHAAA